MLGTLAEKVLFLVRQQDKGHGCEAHGQHRRFKVLPGTLRLLLHLRAV